MYIIISSNTSNFNHNYNNEYLLLTESMSWIHEIFIIQMVNFLRGSKFIFFVSKENSLSNH